VEQIELRVDGESYAEALERLARALIGRTLVDHDGDVDAAAGALQVEREVLESEMDRLGLARGGG
jgi:DNA-binding NtrC family response regulator